MKLYKIPKMNTSIATSKEKKVYNPNNLNPNTQVGRQSPHHKNVSKDVRVEHQFFNKMPDINSVENDLMKMLNDFSETRLKKYGIKLIQTRLSIKKKVV